MKREFVSTLTVHPHVDIRKIRTVLPRCESRLIGTDYISAEVPTSISLKGSDNKMKDIDCESQPVGRGYWKLKAESETAEKNAF